ncbi:NID [Mytilus coruscus]|uniref:NID n=1 Tax=Mytilus coruscus TaxID=42192 RepID=A0A6J8A5L5_MYTCO|nr:NID [Mytilus coruscus]
MTFKGYPYDICYIEENTVAVTLPDSHQILKINLVNREITTTITRKKSYCFGIDSNGETIVTLERRDLKAYATFLDLAGKKLRCIKKNGLFWECVTVYGGKLYCTDWRRNKVLCMDENGDKVWEIDNELINPRGIGVDNNQFIYVACKNNVNIISPDGVTSRIILPEADGIKNANSIFVDRNSQTLLVSNMRDGNAFVFDI